MTRVLIADDNLTNLYLLESLLKGSGYDVTSARNGAEALDMAKKNPPDLIVSDILMPVMDGFELCRRWRADERLESIPFIFYTATYTEPKDERLALNIGADRFIIKPQKPDALIVVVQEILNEARQKIPGFPAKPLEDEMEILREYNKVLFRKLEKRVKQYEDEIANRKRAEEVLRESRQILEGVLNSIPVRVFWKDKNLIYTGCNIPFACDAGFEKPEDIIGKDDYAMGWRKQADLYRGDDKTVIASGTSKLLFEEPQTTPSGEIIYLLTSKIPLRDASGNIVGILGTYLDITERKQAEEKIKLANRKLALMTDVTYQDIQNKVTALRGYIELGKEPFSDKERKSFIEKESKVLESIHTLIRHTKDYQQMGVDQCQWIPVENEIRMQASLISRMKSLSLDIDLHGLECYTDPLICRVFYNLIDNAIKHGKTLTRISFGCHETPGGIIILCEDDGVGIPIGQKAHIFDRVVGGEGKFGLFFVHEFLDMSGMTITETGEPGKGARFEITVPKGMYRFTGTRATGV